MAANFSALLIVRNGYIDVYFLLDLKKTYFRCNCIWKFDGLSRLVGEFHQRSLILNKSRYFPLRKNTILKVLSLSWLGSDVLEPTVSPIMNDPCFAALCVSRD